MYMGLALFLDEETAVQMFRFSQVLSGTAQTDCQVSQQQIPQVFHTDRFP